MKRVRLLTIVFCSLLIFCSSRENKLLAQTKVSERSEKRLEDLRQRFYVTHSGILFSNTWSLIHAYSSKTDSDNILKCLEKFFAPIQAKDEARFQAIGGAKAFKEEISGFLKSEDDAVKGFAAVILGIIGDADFAPPLAAFLEERDASFTDERANSAVTYRGRAAMALGLLGAKEYTAKIAVLLRSRNDYDRTGAVAALGYLDAKEYAGDIVGLLVKGDFKSVDDASPIHYLIVTGTAKDYKKELVGAMLDSSGIEIRKAAIYAFVKLESRENAADIAKLLTDEFRKGDAAKALALLNAKEYSDEIAALLGDEDSSVRKDAALALGVLKAKNYADKIAARLKDKESNVRYYAAVALVLLEASEHYKEAVSIIEESHRAGRRLNEGDFHALTLDKSRQIMADFKRLLEAAESLK